MEPRVRATAQRDTDSRSLPGPADQQTSCGCGGRRAAPKGGARKLSRKEYWSDLGAAKFSNSPQLRLAVSSMLTTASSYGQ
ncbi:hypothetical protein GN956_G26516 [Arapaima gigas]